MAGNFALLLNSLLTMGGLDPPIQGSEHQCLRFWMAGSKAGHGE
jgi:hypothetical protein